MLVNYDFRNELSIFWVHGITKIDFANKIILLSIILTVLQISIGSFFSPLYQFKGRELLKNSNIDFFTSLLKPGKFINAVGGLTIFIERKNTNGTFSNIFIDDVSKGQNRTIYAKNGVIIDDTDKKIFKLFNGEVINNDESKINVFKFDQIDFNLAEYSSNTILVPKIQETSSRELFECSYRLYVNKVENIGSRCKKSIHKEINQELLKRFYKPLYIPIIAILCCFIFIVSKNNSSYSKNRKIIFLITFFVLLLSEASLRYSTISSIATTIYLVTPWVIFTIVYLHFYNRTKYV